MPDATPATALHDRALIRLSGEDVRGFLQGLVTQDVEKVAPGSPQWSGLLTPQGKALFDFIIWDDGADLLLDCEDREVEALIRRLSIYRLRRPLYVGLESTLGVHWSPTKRADAPRDPRLRDLGWRWLAEQHGEDASAAWRAHRLSLGVTEGVAELGQDKTLWLEANAAELNGVSFAKGCYVGQENTARMHYRGKVNRRLVVAPLSEAGDRTRVTYLELGLMVELRRIEALGDALVPEWLGASH
ncbi:folate-binding protein [Sphingomonas sp.]|jgi:hypothetical protein|uniref:CAF17-like 4Fe-4S cluster assembly/insertion protein YgfZ n=1 Tax=Sphingomonas sp. TaxID=28214 RepID=UPI002EDB06E2